MFPHSASQSFRESEQSFATIQRTTEVIISEEITDVVVGVTGVSGVMDESHPRTSVRDYTSVFEVILSPVEGAIQIHVTDETIGHTFAVNRVVLR